MSQYHADDGVKRWREVLLVRGFTAEKSRSTAYLLIPQSDRSKQDIEPYRF